MLVKRGKCLPSPACNYVCCQGCDFHLPDKKCGKIPKPDGCKVYPHNPMALEKGCTYWFEDTETHGKITAENLDSFSEEKRREWLHLTVERSEDE